MCVNSEGIETRVTIEENLSTSSLETNIRRPGEEATEGGAFFWSRGSKREVSDEELGILE